MSKLSRFLLYIDILGFAEMTRREPRKVTRIYSILDSLNMHQHGNFKTIVFSDTVLVYNHVLATTDRERNYLVWYLIEFAEDLHHRLTGQDAYFRSVLTSGNFAHYTLKNIACFYGEALVKAYQVEKQIPSIGLFIDSACNKHNEYFRTAPFEDDLHFVYLNRHLEYLDKYSGGRYPISDTSLEDQAPFVPWQVRFMRDVYLKMRQHPSPTVRAKFLTHWDFHRLRHPGLMQTLESNQFSLESLAGRPAWRSETNAMIKSIKYYKRIGSGTALSRDVSAER